MGILSGMVRFLFIGFCALGIIALYLFAAFKISESRPTLGRFLKTLVLAGFYAVLLSAISGWFIGSRAAVYLLPLLYLFSLFEAWRELKPEPHDEPPVGNKPDCRPRPRL